MTFDEWFLDEYGFSESQNLPGLKGMCREAWNAAVFASSEAVDGCLKERQPSAFYAAVIRRCHSSEQKESA